MTNEELTSLKAEARDLLNQVVIKLKQVPLSDVVEYTSSWDEFYDGDSDEWKTTPQEEKDKAFLTSVREYCKAALDEESTAITVEEYYSSNC